MGLSQLQHWGRAQLLHDRVRSSTSRPADLLLPDVNIVHIKRCSPVHPKHIQRQAERLGVGFRSRVLADTRAPRDAAAELTRALQEPEVREWLQDDVTDLVRIFGEELGYPSVSAKLEVLGGTPCPRFHADHVGVRLLVTYCGPGTLYVENRHVRRRWLWRGEGGVAVASAEAAAARQAAAADLLFLKGHAAPGNYGMGAVHRSPDLLSGPDLNSGLGPGSRPLCEALEPNAGTGSSSAGGRLDGAGAVAPMNVGRASGSGGRGKDGRQPLRLLLTVDDVVGWATQGEACGCGRPHAGREEEEEAGAHRADATLVVR